MFIEQITRRLAALWSQPRERISIDMSEEELKDHLQFGRDDEEPGNRPIFVSKLEVVTK